MALPELGTQGQSGAAPEPVRPIEADLFWYARRVSVTDAHRAEFAKIIRRICRIGMTNSNSDARKARLPWRASGRPTFSPRHRSALARNRSQGDLATRGRRTRPGAPASGRVLRASRADEGDDERLAALFRLTRVVAVERGRARRHGGILRVLARLHLDDDFARTVLASLRDRRANEGRCQQEGDGAFDSAHVDCFPSCLSSGKSSAGHRFRSPDRGEAVFRDRGPTRGPQPAGREARGTLLCLTAVTSAGGG